jgi:putative ABC transport system substrate-binding protein
MSTVRRREFIAGAAASAAWPVVARAQQPQRMRRIGVLWPFPESDPVAQADIAELRRALQKLGWTEGHNLRIDYRWGASGARADQYVDELIALAPDAIVTSTGSLVSELQRASSTVPIVFSAANEPIGAGLIEGLARPGTNATGLAMVESSQSAKLLELLKEIAPRLNLAAVVRSPGGTGGAANFGAIQAAAGSLGMQVRPINAGDGGAIERGIAALAHEQNAGIVVPAGGGAFNVAN